MTSDRSCLLMSYHTWHFSVTLLLLLYSPPEHTHPHTHTRIVTQLFTYSLYLSGTAALKGFFPDMQTAISKASGARGELLFEEGVSE